MVRLKRSNMSVLKDVVIETEEGVIAEAWIALLQTGICINSRYAFFDGFYYKDDVLLRDTGIVSQFRVYCGHKIMKLTFGSGTDKEQFRRFIENTDGIGAPPPSLAALSISPSPPAPPPSLASSSGEMDRTKAQNELERRENGTFLVRIRPNIDDKGKYALTLKTNNTVKHMKICNTNDLEKKYYLSLSKFFSTIEELVLNYQVNSLKENFERLEEDAKLLWPYRQLLATVIRNFEPTDNCHLALREGQTLYVIGKEGYGEGWWKGRNEYNESGYFPNVYVKVEGDAKFHN